MKKILLIEDCQGPIRKWKRELQDLNLEFLGIDWGMTVAQARELFFSNRENISIVVVDGELEPTEDSDGMTFGLVREIRGAGFTGPMIAASSMESRNEELLRCGCDKTAWGKEGVPKVVRQIIQEVSSKP